MPFHQERAEAATNTQRPHCSLIVCQHDKSNVSRGIIYMRTVINKLITRLLNFRIFLVRLALCLCLCIAFVCYFACSAARLHDNMHVVTLIFMRKQESHSCLTFSVIDVFGATPMLWQREGKEKKYQRKSDLLELHV